MYAEIQMSLAADLARLADAAERIAAALEAGRDDPDAYEYDGCSTDEIGVRRADGWQVLGMSIEHGSIALRRPRQQE